VPAWAANGNVYSVMRTPEELSIVCAEDSVPAGVRSEGGWIALKLEGPFPFAMTGVLTSFTVPLAEAAISLFALSTFNTDYVLVKHQQFDAALQALARAGHTLADETPA